jgi:NADPH-dependent curcumin reductase CurA
VGINNPPLASSVRTWVSSPFGTSARGPEYAGGDIVLSYGGWQEYAVSNGTGLRKLDPAAAPISTALGVLGMPGMTAYVGLLEIGQPKPGETVVVAAASGAVLDPTMA